MKNTQIGKDVNNLRKLSRTVKEESKAIVQVWKGLLPYSELNAPVACVAKKRVSYVESFTSPSLGTQQTTNNNKGCLVTGTPPSSVGHKHSSKPSQTKGRHRETSSHSNMASTDKDVKGLDDFSKAMLGAPCKNPLDDDAEPNDCTSGSHEEETPLRKVTRIHKAAIPHRDGHISKSHRDIIYKSEVTKTVERLPKNSMAIPNCSNAEKPRSPVPASVTSNHHTASSPTVKVKESPSVMEESATNTRKRKGMSIELL